MHDARTRALPIVDREKYAVNGQLYARRWSDRVMLADCGSCREIPGDPAPGIIECRDGRIVMTHLSWRTGRASCRRTAGAIWARPTNGWESGGEPRQVERTAGTSPAIWRPVPRACRSGESVAVRHQC